MTDGGAISWRSIVYGTPVTAADGRQVGTVREVLGDDAEDIFHGIRVSLSQGHRDVMVGSEDISELTAGSIQTTLSAEQLSALPAYNEAATYHLASVGWLRHHLGWKKDATSDEEPG
jgi:hypothetical protein